MIGTKVDRAGNRLGSILWDYTTNQVIYVTDEQLKSKLKAMPNLVSNVQLVSGALRGTNGSMDRYTKFYADTNASCGKHSALIVRQVDGAQAYIVANIKTDARAKVGFIVASGIIPEQSIIEAVKANKFDIANGKVVNINGKEYISSIKGEYKREVVKGQTQSKPQPQPQPQPQLQPTPKPAQPQPQVKQEYTELNEVDTKGFKVDRQGVSAKSILDSKDVCFLESQAKAKQEYPEYIKGEYCIEIMDLMLKAGLPDKMAHEAAFGSELLYRMHKRRQVLYGGGLSREEIEGRLKQELEQSTKISNSDTSGMELNEIDLDKVNIKGKRSESLSSPIYLTAEDVENVVGLDTMVPIKLPDGGVCEVSVVDKLEMSLSTLKAIKPFHYGLLTAAQLIPTNAINTMAVTVDKLLVSPEYVATSTVSELMFTLIHEAYHLMMRHPERLNGRDANIFNTVTDLYINKIIADDFGIDRPGKPVLLYGNAVNNIKGSGGKSFSSAFGPQLEEFKEIVLPLRVLFAPNLDTDKTTPEILYSVLHKEVQSEVDKILRQRGKGV